MNTVAFHTLGCKVNQYDTQAMLELFRAAGYAVVPFSENADVYVVNTCTVTGTGDKKSMQLARRLRREHPESEIILCGCLAQRKGEALLDTAADSGHPAPGRGGDAVGKGRARWRADLRRGRADHADPL